MFTVINNAHCVLNCAGVFKQCDLYEYGGFVHAKFGSGYVRLYQRAFGVNPTSKAKVSWEEVAIPDGVMYDSFTKAMKVMR